MFCGALGSTAGLGESQAHDGETGWLCRLNAGNVVTEQASSILSPKSRMPGPQGGILTPKLAVTVGHPNVFIGFMLAQPRVKFVKGAMGKRRPQGVQGH